MAGHVTGTPRAHSMKIVWNEIRDGPVPLGRTFSSGGVPLASLPLATSEVEFELENVDVEVVNGLRRAATDEMPGRCLVASGYDMDLSTEPMAFMEFVCARIAQIPLRPQIPQETVQNLVLRIDYRNDTQVPVNVYAGDMVVARGALPAPLFNPTHVVAFLQPGRRLVIHNIAVRAGSGVANNASYNVLRHGRYEHLDLERYDRAETHLRGGARAEVSPYKESTYMVRPLRHRFRGALCATPNDPDEVKSVFVDACVNVIARLASIARELDAPDASRASFSVSPMDIGAAKAPRTACVLRVPGETNTIGGILTRAVFNRDPGLSFVTHSVDNSVKELAVTVHAVDALDLLKGAVADSVAIFERLRDDFRALAPEMTVA